MKKSCSNSKNKGKGILINIAIIALLITGLILIWTKMDESPVKEL